MTPQLNRFLTVLAIVGAALWLGYEGYRHFLVREPGDAAYFAGNRMFDDGYYERALNSYEAALAEAPKHLPAMRGLANSLIQLKRYEAAIAVMDRAIAIDPDFGGHYAIRGIAEDHLGRTEQAMADYETSLRLDKELAEGMHWLDRLLYNVQEKPPTVADRLRYLKAEMQKPEDERLLRVPEVDAAQRPYEQ